MSEEEVPEEVKDVEGYTQQRRLKSIYDLRDELHQQRKRVRAAESSQRDRFSALCIYRGIVDSYTLELEPLLRKYQNGVDYLTQTDFGTVTVRPNTETSSTGMGRGERVKAYNPKDGNYRAIKGQPDPVEYELTGLQSLLEIENPLEVTFAFQTTGRRGTSTFEHTVRQQVEMVTLDKMVRVMNTFLADIGFELEPEEEDDPAHIGI